MASENENDQFMVEKIFDLRGDASGGGCASEGRTPSCFGLREERRSRSPPALRMPPPPPPLPPLPPAEPAEPAEPALPRPLEKCTVPRLVSVPLI